MRTLLILTCLLMSGCVTFSYTDGTERMSGTAWFKSAEGLRVVRPGFELNADTTKTESQQMTVLMMEMARLLMSVPR